MRVMELNEVTDSEDTVTVLGEVVPSNNILSANLRRSMYNKRKLQVSAHISGKKMRQVGPCKMKSIDGGGNIKHEVVPSNNILSANLRRSMYNKRKLQVSAHISGKKMRQVGPCKMKSIDGGGNIKHTQTAMAGLRALDG
jgi:ribosome maturation protein Sdo1